MTSIKNSVESPKGENVAQIFVKYDKNRTGAIEIDELRDVMSDLGLLGGRSNAEKASVVVAAFTAADTDRDNALSLEEFTAFYLRATAPRLSDFLHCQYPDAYASLRTAFHDWASFGASHHHPHHPHPHHQEKQKQQQNKGAVLGSAHWLKLCRDTKLVAPGALTSTDADLIYAKVKPRGQQRIGFSHFVDALGAVAARLNRDLISVVTKVIESPGPVVNGTVVKAERFSYSGETTAPTPTSTTDIDTAATKNRRRFSAPPLASSSVTMLAPTTTTMTTKQPEKQQKQSVKRQSGDEFTIPAVRGSSSEGEYADDGGNTARSQNVLKVFGAFAGFGSTSTPTPTSTSMLSPIRMEMDSKQFMKLCRDAGLVTSPATAVAADLCFAKAKSRGTRRISYADFLVALALLAQEQGKDEEEVLKQVAVCPGPRRNSVVGVPEYTRLHDDKSTYTGVYARGGPQVVDDIVPDLAKLLSTSLRR